jgi:hypothetical protein
VIFLSATTESTKFLDSIGIEPGANYHSTIEIKAKRAFNPTDVLGPSWNKQLHALYTNKHPIYSFMNRAREALLKDPQALESIKSSDLILEYYIYSMEYMFSVLKWVPKGTRR